MGFRGSEEFIRLQFEEYLQALIASVKYQNYLTSNANNPKAILDHIDGDPSLDFGAEWVEAWKKSDNYRLWNANTDSHLFDIVEPRHPCAGGLSIDDVQRRIQQQVQDLHLDETFAVGREVLGRNLAAGRDKASTVFSRLYADMEALREAQRKKAEEARATKATAEKNGVASVPGSPDPSKPQHASSDSVSSRASAYIGSWTSWAGQKRRQGWGRSGSHSSDRGSFNGTSGGGGWGLSLRRGRNRDSSSGTPLGSPLSPSSPTLSTREKFQMISLAAPGRPSESSDDDNNNSSNDDKKNKASRPTTGDSFGESVLDAADSGSEGGASSNLGSPKAASTSASASASEKRASRKIEGETSADASVDASADASAYVSAGESAGAGASAGPETDPGTAGSAGAGAGVPTVEPKKEDTTKVEEETAPTPTAGA